jgi:2-C-methyl-D-erythritol 4-phosphate cytidylyltransferase
MSVVVALVPVAWRDERLGRRVPEALVPVRGQPLLVHAVRGLLAAECVDRVLVVAPEPNVDVVAESLASAGADAVVVPGGATRTDSVRLAFRAAGDPTVVLVHDVTRAFTPPDVIRSVVAAVRAGAPAVIPVLPVADTVKRVDADGVVLETADRSRLRRVQSPQGFAADVFHRGYPDGGGLDVPIATVPGHPHGMRIATPFDVTVAEAMLP